MHHAKHFTKLLICRKKTDPFQSDSMPPLLLWHMYHEKGAPHCNCNTEKLLILFFYAICSFLKNQKT